MRSALSPLLTIRNFSITSPTYARITSRVSGLSLSDFLLRQRVLGLWRDIVRATNKIPKESSARTELKTFAREEFERNRAVRDTTKIRYLVSTGRTMFDEIRMRFAGGL